MNKKKMWVPIVRSLVLVVALLVLPVSAQAGPMQGADVSAIASERPTLDTSPLAQLWNQLLERVGLASGQSSKDATSPAPPTTLEPFSSQELTTQEAPLENGGDLRTSIDPAG